MMAGHERVVISAKPLPAAMEAHHQIRPRLRGFLPRLPLQDRLDYEPCKPLWEDGLAPARHFRFPVQPRACPDTSRSAAHLKGLQQQLSTPASSLT